MDDDEPAFPEDIAVTTIAPFRRAQVPAVSERLAGTVMDAKPIGLFGLGAGAVTVLGSIGVTTWLAWQWFVAHAVVVLGVPLAGLALLFVVFVRGAKQREGRLLADVDQHTRTQVEKSLDAANTRHARELRELRSPPPFVWDDQAVVRCIHIEARRSQMSVGDSMCIVFEISNTSPCGVTVEMLGCNVNLHKRNAAGNGYEPFATSTVGGWACLVPAFSSCYQHITEPIPIFTDEAVTGTLFERGVVRFMVNAQFVTWVEPSKKTTARHKAFECYLVAQ